MFGKPYAVTVFLTSSLSLPDSVPALHSQIRKASAVPRERFTKELTAIVSCGTIKVMRSTRDVIANDRSAHFSDPPLVVLASLADGPKHGYAMIDEIERMTGERLGPGTLYGAITRLEQQGLVEPLAAEERRRPYRLTAPGRRALRAKLVAMRQVALLGLRKLEAQ
jgi:DNA-binding PadR family transcriptional regulator